jgi:tocopherol O-methyltransferase
MQSTAAMHRYNEKDKIIQHYDMVSPYYQSLWGNHIHHGYWIRGDESKEAAQEQLIDYVAGLAGIQPGFRLLDIGCGFGGTSLSLAHRYGVSATGITISSVQVDMANRSAAERKLDAKFLLMDAEALQFAEQFDALWSLESISHYHDPAAFFVSAAEHLKPGGSFALTDWFRKEGLSAAQKKKHIEPIEKGMFVELHEMDEYEHFLNAAGFRITHRQVLNERCAKTWDLGASIIKDSSFWTMAARQGPHFVTYLKAFQALRAGYASGNFVYGLFVAKKPLNEHSGA